MEYAVTVALLTERLSYDPDTGVFTHRKTGKQAGTEDSDGYIRIGLNRKTQAAHRLAFLYMTGDWPTKDVDHMNGVRSANRWDNLREATRQENNADRTRLKNNNSGTKNVFWHEDSQRWGVKVGKDDKYYTCGNYDDFELTTLVANTVRNYLHGEYSRT